MTSVILRLNLCLDIENKAKKKCKNFKKFFNEYLHIEQIYVGFITKDVKFDKDDYDDPFKIAYVLGYSRLGNNIKRYQTVYLSKTVVVDDDGLFFSNEKLYMDNGYSWTNNNFLFFDKINSDDEVTQINNSYYSFEIFVDFNYDYYTRKYMKFQDVLAVLVSLMN